MPDYKLIPDSIQDKFGKLRASIQIFGGGFGNGKTAAAVVQKVLKIGKDYPGANILVARSTYPKLNDTIRKEFLKWCPPSWIKSFPRSKNSDNTCTFVNGTTINFRYIAQQGKGVSEGEQTTSNLLSATYDLVVVDQLEDPEITEKDFDDLQGRLRGSAPYIGTDPTMPRTGPRWLVATLNPTRNWCYRRIIAPLIKYNRTGIIDDNLLCERYPRDHEKADQAVLDEFGKPRLLVELVEGSTYTNSHNLDPDFLIRLESIYRGQQKDRFLYGEWAAYEGLVHPEFSEVTHLVAQREIGQYLDDLYSSGVIPRFIEAYDFGMAVPSCYLLAFVNRHRDVIVCDGFYVPENEMRIAEQQREISRIRLEWGCDSTNVIRADPQLFKRTSVLKDRSAKTIAQLFAEGDYGVQMRRAENEIASGLVKVNMYLNIAPNHRHPIHQTFGSPHILFATELEFLQNEFTAYYWKQDTAGKRTDEPIDTNDHAMNTLKYMLSKEPDLADRVPRTQSMTYLHNWSEGADVTKSRSIRHGQ